MDLKKQEEHKRDQAWDPQEKWRLILETIAWAESQLPPEQRRNRPRGFEVKTKNAAAQDNSRPPI